MNQPTTLLKILMVACVLVFPRYCFGQTVTMPESIKVDTGRLAAIDIQHDGDACEWKLIGDADVFREYDPSAAIKLRIIGYKQQTCWLVVAASKDGKLSPIKTTKIEIGAAGKPDDPVVPPKPEIDNTYNLGLAAYNLAPTKDNQAAAKIYRDAADFVKGVNGNFKKAAADDGKSTDESNVLIWIRLQMDQLPSAAAWKQWRSGMVDPFMESQKAKPRGYTSDDWYAAFHEVANAIEAKK